MKFLLFAALVMSMLAAPVSASTQVSGRYGYATNDRILSVIDTDNLSVIARIPLGAHAILAPVEHVFYGYPVYVATSESILVIDQDSWTVVNAIPIANVSALAVSPRGRQLYAVSPAPGTSTEGILNVIDTQTFEIRQPTLPNTTRGTPLLVIRSINRLYLNFATTECCDYPLSVIDTQTLTILDELPVSGSYAVADPTRRWLYIRGDNEIVVVDIATNSVSTRIALPRPHDGATVIEFSASGDSAYIGTSPVGGAGFGGDPGQMLVVDVQSHQIIATIELDLRPIAMAQHDFRSLVFVSGQRPGNVGRPTQLLPAGVRVIDIPTRSVIASIEPLSAEPYIVGPDSLTYNNKNHVLYSRDSSAVYGIDGRDFYVRSALPPATALLIARSSGYSGSNVHDTLGTRDGAITAQQWGAPGDYSLPADYSGDGRADLVVLRPSEGSEQAIWYIRDSNSGATIRQQWGAVALGDVPVPADYDGDGRTDIAMWRPDVGEWFIRLSSGGLSQTRFGIGSDFPVPGDYDGDGRDDLAVYDAGNWQLFGSTSGLSSIQLGEGLDLPVPGDYDGDSRTDAAVYNPISGIWRLQQSNSPTPRSVQWGGPGDIPVPADYDGDGATDIAIWRPATGTWWIIASNSGGISSIPWGRVGDRPQPADYDGDGKADVSVHRP